MAEGRKTFEVPFVYATTQNYVKRFHLFFFPSSTQFFLIFKIFDTLRHQKLRRHAQIFSARIFVLNQHFLKSPVYVFLQDGKKSVTSDLHIEDVVCITGVVQLRPVEQVKQVKIITVARQLNGSEGNYDPNQKSNVVWENSFSPPTHTHTHIHTYIHTGPSV